MERDPEEGKRALEELRLWTRGALAEMRVQKTRQVFDRTDLGVIVTEAGGRITTFDGGDYDIYSANILASNGGLHADLIACIRT